MGKKMSIGDPRDMNLAAQGWECPKCGAINAPWALQCPCSRPKKGVVGNDNSDGLIWIDDDPTPTTITFNASYITFNKDEINRIFGETPDWNEEE